jgi:hypothetical protein
MRAVADGVATPRDAVRHSATGTVEMVTIDHGRALPDRCLLCTDLPEDLLPTADRRVPLAA